jgi:hypothetical protein
MQRKHLIGLAVAAALASVGAYAQQGGLTRQDVIEAVSPDVPAHRVSPKSALRTPAPLTAKAAATRAAAAPTVDDVYDVDSFGREVVYLGLTSAFVTLEDTCPAPDPAVPDQFCQTLNPTPGAVTPFSFNDMARLKLPPKSTHSLLCYWFSPLINVTYSNPTAARATALFRYTPTLTVENPVLADPALIDPTTGAPFGGQLLTSMSASEVFQVPLESGVTFTERTRDSAVCMAGSVSKRALIETYGLTEAQATEFFKQPTTVRLNVTGSSRYVAFAGLTMGLRLVGDKR